jgi:hypothetical protein
MIDREEYHRTKGGRKNTPKITATMASDTGRARRRLRWGAGDVMGTFAAKVELR